MSTGGTSILFDIKTLRHTKRFHDNRLPINSLDIRAQGDYIASTSLDESINIYDAATGQHRHKILSKKYGVSHLRFSGHAEDQVVTASLNGWDHTIRQLALIENKFLRYFTGHRATVNSIELSPAVKDSFLSSSKDDTIRLWDFRTPTCQGCIREEDAHISFDPLGLVVAAAVPNGILNLHDFRMFDAGPFQCYQLQGLPIDPPTWCSVQFSPSGELLLLSTHSSSIYLIDSFNGTRLCEFQTRTNSDGSPIPATFSPDGSSIITGSTNGNIHIYDTVRREEITILCADDSPVTLSRFHPSLPLIATGGKQLHLWTAPPSLMPYTR